MQAGGTSDTFVQKIYEMNKSQYKKRKENTVEPQFNEMVNFRDLLRYN